MFHHIVMSSALEIPAIQIQIDTISIIFCTRSDEFASSEDEISRMCPKLSPKTFFFQLNLVLEP